MAQVVEYWVLVQTSGVQFPQIFNFFYKVTCTDTQTHTHLEKESGPKQSLGPLKISQTKYEWPHV